MQGSWFCWRTSFVCLLPVYSRKSKLYELREILWGKRGMIWPFVYRIRKKLWRVNHVSATLLYTPSQLMNCLRNEWDGWLRLIWMDLKTHNKYENSINIVEKTLMKAFVCLYVSENHQQTVDQADASVRAELEEERRRYQSLLREFTRLEQRYDNLRDMSVFTTNEVHLYWELSFKTKFPNHISPHIEIMNVTFLFIVWGSHIVVSSLK